MQLEILHQTLKPKEYAMREIVLKHDINYIIIVTKPICL